MRIPLQKIGFKDSDYERPSQTWVCGWTREGNPCKHGPDGNGHCTAAAHAKCKPSAEGDRWICTRAGAFGGACAEGPRPDGTCSFPKPEHLVCQPHRSIRSKRGRFVLLVTALTFGFLLLMLTGPWRLGFFSPGELSSTHLAIKGENIAENCMSCHTNGNLRLSTWFKLAMNLDNEEDSIHGASERCLTCHFKGNSLARAQVMSVHGVDQLKLEEMTREASTAVPDHTAETHDASEAAATTKTTSAASQVAGTMSQLLLANIIHGPVDGRSGDIACANCHQEHRGMDQNLILMSDAQCQVCHQHPFESFNDGHPQFGLVPRQNGGIAFDHVKHKERFSSGKLNCLSCHSADRSGRAMKVRLFEEACEGCHNQGSQDHHGDAIRKNPLVLLQLPEMEFEAEMYWPAEAYGEFLAPMTTMLLAGDDEALALIEMIYDENGADGDLYEWLIETEENDEPHLRNQLAQALKRLISDLADYTKEGTRVRTDRLAKALGTTADNRAVGNLAKELSSANFVMQSFKQRYLPQLDKDIAGKVVSADDDVQLATHKVVLPSVSGWGIDANDGMISYRPISHADGLLRYWMDALKTHASKPPDVEADTMSQTRHELRKRLYIDLKSDFNACTKCHTQEEQVINWRAADRASGSSGYARFNHSPHIAMLPEQNSCETCHALGKHSSTSDNETSWPHGFLAHQNKQCESCHAPDRANNSCLTCHQYHEFRP